MISPELILSFLPFVILFIFVVVARVSVLRSMIFVWAFTAVSLLFLWKVSAINVAASFLKGLFLAGEIVLILFGAVWIVQILKEKKHMGDLQRLLSSISDDARIQVIIIAWLFGSLMEGVSGFGTPAMIVAPLLVSIGFPAILSVVVALVSNSTAVSFGAAGTPIIFGVGSAGFDSTFLSELGVKVALIHSLVSFVVPLAIVFFVVKTLKNEEGFWKSYLEVVPFCFLAWISFVVPFYLTAYFVGPELPSIIASVFSLLVCCVVARTGFLVPKNKISFSKKSAKRSYNKKSVFLAIFPYFVLISLLFLTRVIATLKKYVSNFSLGWSNILSTDLSFSFLPFYTPSFYFILAGLTSLFVFGFDRKTFYSSVRYSWSRIRIAFLALIFSIGLVQLFIISGTGSAGILSMPLVLAQFFVKVFGSYFVFVSPFVGVFGAFLTGSNTVSNILFTTFQVETARLLGISIIGVLALQVVGGAVGNMIAIHNVLAANSVAGIYGKEGEVIRKTIFVCLIYALLVGIAGFLVARFLI